MTASINRKTVLIIQPIHAAGTALLKARKDIDLRVIHSAAEADVIAAVADVDAILVRTASINRAIIAAAPRLSVVSRHGVGYDAVDTVACSERDIAVTITPGTNATSVAEHAMMMLLALAKNALYYHTATTDGRFTQARHSMSALDIEEWTLLIVGFGRIGSRLAPRALAFGMRVLVYDPYVRADVIHHAGCTPVFDLRRGLAKCNAVTVHTPLTPETVDLIAAAEIATMGSGSFIINTARGGIVNEIALAEGLRSGHIAAAGIDVFAVEPVTVDHPLLQFENVLLSAHSAGVSQQACIRTSKQAVGNILDYFDGCLNPDVVVN